MLLKYLRTSLKSSYPKTLRLKKRSCTAIILRVSDSKLKMQNGVVCNQIEALYIKRVHREGDRWSGHVAFPGGHQDKEDGLNDMVRSDLTLYLKG